MLAVFRSKTRMSTELPAVTQDEHPERWPYLAATPIVDFNHPAVAALAAALAEAAVDGNDIIARCFTWVRDQVGHSADIGATAVTCSASQALHHRTGICFAKSHLLAALLRANGIPSGFCYQRLSIEGGPDGPHSLHGLNAVWIQDGWFRIDARGNRHDIDAQFTPPVERIAFQPDTTHGEYDLPGVLAEPLPSVVLALQSAQSIPQLWAKLPDVS